MRDTFFSRIREMNYELLAEWILEDLFRENATELHKFI